MYREPRVRAARSTARMPMGAPRSVPFDEFRFRLSDEAEGDETVAEDASSPRYRRHSTIGPRMNVVFRNNHPALVHCPPPTPHDLCRISATGDDRESYPMLFTNNWRRSLLRRLPVIPTLTSWGVARRLQMPLDRLDTVCTVACSQLEALPFESRHGRCKFTPSPTARQAHPLH